LKASNVKKVLNGVNDYYNDVLNMSAKIRVEPQKVAENQEDHIGKIRHLRGL